MTTAKHADFQALSAFVDGEAPEWADHVAGCPQCRATAAELRALSARVAAPADPAPAALREAAIAAALDASGLEGAGARRLEPAAAARHQAHRARFARLAPRSWAMPAIAAVVLACVGFAGVILSSTRSTDHETLAGPALDTKAESAVPGAPTAPVGDLGDVPDPATLRARALGTAPPSTVAASRSAASSSNSGAASDSSALNAPSSGAAVSGSSGVAPATGAGGAGGSATVIAPNAVGTRPCEDRARAREPGLGPLTYFATARRGTVPAYVLGFSTGPTVTLLMLAQDGCAELLRSAGP